MAGIKLQYGKGFTIYHSKNGVLYETIPSFKSADMYYDEIDDFLKSSIEGHKSRGNIDNVIVASEVIEAIYKSAATRKEVAFR